MRPWLRHALVFGAISALATLLVVTLEQTLVPGVPCQKSSLPEQLMFLLFLLLMGSAGFMTTRAGETVGMAGLSGFLGALMSAVGTMVAFVIFIGLASCPPALEENFHTPATTLMFAVVAGIFFSTIGLGFGAAAGVIGGLIGRRQPAR